MEAIYAIDSNGGLSKEGTIPWKSKKDLKFFADKTKYNVVIMGKNTYFSLPDNVRPLKDRLNIILTSNPSEYSHIQSRYNNIVFTDYENIYSALISDRTKVCKSHPYLNLNFKIFFIGGKTIYEKYIHICERVWVTIIKKDYKCDLKFNYDFSIEFKKPKVIDEDHDLQIFLYEKIFNL